jgi:hypothetical protein
MTTLTNEEQTTQSGTGTAQEPKASKKATVAPRKPRVAPAKGKSGKKTTSAKKGAKAPKKGTSAKAEGVTSAKAEGVREGSKTGKILDLLKRPDGATLQELMKLTGWQAHSVRGFLSGTIGKKMALAVTSTKGEDGTRTYSIKA